MQARNVAKKHQTLKQLKPEESQNLKKAKANVLKSQRFEEPMF